MGFGVSRSARERRERDERERAALASERSAFGPTRQELAAQAPQRQELQQARSEEQRLKQQVVSGLGRTTQAARELAGVARGRVDVAEKRKRAIEQLGQQQRTALQQEAGRASAQAFGGLGRVPVGGARSAALRQQALDVARQRTGLESGVETALATQEQAIQQARESAAGAQFGAEQVGLQAAIGEQAFGTELGQAKQELNQIQRQIAEQEKAGADPRQIARFLEQQLAITTNPAVRAQLSQLVAQQRAEGGSFSNIFERDVLPGLSIFGPLLEPFVTEIFA